MSFQLESEIIKLPSREMFERELHLGEVGCFGCRNIFAAPVAEGWHANKFPTLQRIKCPHCGTDRARENYRCHPMDPGKHPLGWPYDDWTIPYDC